MGFVMAGLDKADYDREYSDIALLKRILSYFSPYRSWMAIIGISIGIYSLAGALIPFYISQLLDTINPDLGIPQSKVFLLVGLVILFAIINFIFNALRQVLTARSVQSAVVDMRQEALDALLERDMAFFDTQPTGRLASRTLNDTNDYGQVVSLSVNLLGQLFVVFFLLIFLFNYSVRLTIVLLIFAPLVILTALLFRKIARSVAINSQRILAKVNALIQETTTGIYVAKSFRAEQTIYEEFEEMNNTSYEINLKRGLVFNSIFPVLNMLIYLGMAMLVFFGGLEVLQPNVFAYSLISWIPSARNEPLTIGEWYFFLQGLSLFFFPLVQIASFWSQFQQGLAASERVFSMIDAENTVVQYDNQHLQSPRGEIEFKNVTFGYTENENVLENFYLKINPGEKLAIVGHTGAGKSTIAKLIQRYYEFQDGTILIDGQNIRSLDLVAFRKQLSIISQEVFLWNGSIRENLLYGIEGIIDDADTKIEQVLQQVEALDWLNQLDKGLETQVGERGGKLSMGQRQLIAFARILLRDPAILIMDEATASLDPFSDLMVQKATNKILEGRTSIIIAHRLSTIKNVDRIIVMKDGKIIEEGNHKSLLAEQGHYAELYDTYFRHQSLEYIESFAESSD